LKKQSGKPQLLAVCGFNFDGKGWRGQSNIEFFWKITQATRFGLQWSSYDTGQ
jgi:hypothetical protein